MVEEVSIVTQKVAFDSAFLLDNKPLIRIQIFLVQGRGEERGELQLPATRENPSKRGLQNSVPVLTMYGLFALQEIKCNHTQAVKEPLSYIPLKRSISLTSLLSFHYQILLQTFFLQHLVLPPTQVVLIYIISQQTLFKPCIFTRWLTLRY